MKYFPLQFRTQIGQDFPHLKINFTDSIFLQCVELTSLANFPIRGLSDYECEVHQKCAIFKARNGKTNEEGDKNNYDVHAFEDQMKGFLGAIRVCVVENKNKKLRKEKLYESLFRLLDFSCCSGFKLIKKADNGYNVGQFVLYYQRERQRKVQDLISCIEAFSSFTVHYPLASLAEESQIPSNIAMQTLKQALNFYSPEIESLATLHLLSVNYMTICRRSESLYLDYDEEKEYFLGLCVEGVISNIHRFYLALEHTVKSFKVKVLPIENIRAVKLNQLENSLKYEKGWRMIDENTLVVMDRGLTEKKVRDLTMGWYVMPKQTFNEEERIALQTEIKGGRFQEYMSSRYVEYEEVLVDQPYVLLQCPHPCLQFLLTNIKSFLSTLQKQTVTCPEFPSPLARKIFHKNYRHLIQKQISVKFVLANNELTRTNFTIDSKLITEQLKEIKEQLLSNFIAVPSLTPISKYLAGQNNFDGLYWVEKNPCGMWERSWKSILYRFGKKINIMLKEFDNLVRFQQQIVFLIHNDLPDSSAIYKICSENEIEVNQFLDGCSGIKSCRVKKFPLENSQRFRSITLLYFDVKRLHTRHIEQDIIACLRSFEKQPKVNFLIGQNSKRFIEDVFPKLLQKMHELSQKEQIVLRDATFYYEEAAILSQIERMIGKAKIQSSVVSRDVFDEWSLLRMNNLKEFVLYYYWNQETFCLPGIDSYVFNFQKHKDIKSRGLVTIPTPEYLQKQFHQFFIDFKTNRIFEICNFSQIMPRKESEVSKEFYKLMQMIRKKFDHVNFFVCYARNIGDAIAKQICLNIYYKAEGVNQPLKPLLFDLKTGKVGLKGGEQLPFQVVQKKYVDWFKIYTHETQIGNIQRCLQK